MGDSAPTDDPVGSPTGRGDEPPGHLLADSMPQLVWTADADGVVDYYNARVSRYMGASREADGTWQWGPLVHDDDVVLTVATWNQAIATGATYVCEHRVHMADGTYRWHLSRAEPVRDPATGAVRWYGTATDVHEQKVAEERLHAALDQLQRLQSVTATLAAPLWSSDEVVEALVNDGVAAAGGSEGIVVLLADRQQPTVHTRRRAADDPAPSWIDSAIAEDGLVAAAVRDRRIKSARAGGEGVVAAVPFPAALGVSGALCTRFAGLTELTPSHRAGLRTVAELGAQALLRARAYEDEQRRADQAEALQALATALAASAAVEEVATSIAAFAGRSAGADFANVAIPVADGAQLRLVHAPWLQPAIAAEWREISVTSSTPLSDAFRTGQPVLLGLDEERRRTYPQMIAAAEKAGFVATASIPAKSQDGVVIGAVGFAWRRAVAFDTDVVAVLDTVVSLCAQALQRAALFEADQRRRIYIERARAAVSGVAGAVTIDDVADVIVGRGAQSLGANVSVMLEATSAEVSIVAAAGDDTAVEDLLDRLAALGSGLDPVVRSLDIVIVDDLVVIPLAPGTDEPIVVALSIGGLHEWSLHRDRLTSLGAQWRQALERARNHDAEQVAHRRTEQLQQLTASLAQATRTTELLDVVQHQLAPDFGARSAGLVLAPDRPPAVGVLTVPLDPADPLGDHLVLDRDAPFEPDERRAAEAVAVQCARALSRIRLAEREHQIATQLQHALLGDVDRIEGLAVGTVYLASEEGLDIGGDWYDVIHREDGTAVLVIGDVVGHSLGAATAMGQLRSAVRALAHLCDSPDSLLDRVAAYSENVRDARYSTLTLVYLDVASGRFEYVCAGHPPPLMVPRDGEAPAFLADGRNGPLGAFPHAVTRTGSGAVPEGGSLVLYTDGLVEHRGRSLDDGLGEIALLCTGLRRLPAELIAPHLADGVFSGVVPRDDVAVLVVAPILCPSLTSTFAANPAHLSSVRNRMRDWLRERGASEAEVTDVLLVAGEAIANAVEHAYHGRGPGLVHVRLEHADDEYRLTVCDDGGWRWPHAPGKRGRGTSIMHALASELVVDRRQRGTTLFASIPATVGVTA